MVFIAYGFGRLLGMPQVKAAVSLGGGLLLVMMGIGMFRSVKHVEAGRSSYPHSPIVAGILLSLGSPYFHIWWATVGASLISRSLQFGLGGFLIFALAHWSCDLMWDWFLSVLSFRGGQFFGKWFQKAVFAVCGTFLLFYSVKSIMDAVRLVTA
jgi:threonine/homoserine/homoserine lactone efflux protein